MSAWPGVPEPAPDVVSELVSDVSDVVLDLSDVVLESVEEEESGWTEVAGEFAVVVGWPAGGDP